MPTRAPEHRRAEDPLIHAAMITPRPGTGHISRPLVPAKSATSYVPATTTPPSVTQALQQNTLATQQNPTRLSVRSSPRLGPPRKSSSSPMRPSVRGQRLTSESSLAASSTSMRVHGAQVPGGCSANTTATGDCLEQSQRLSVGKVVSSTVQEARVYSPRPSRQVFKSSDKLQAHPLCATMQTPTLSSSMERSRTLRAGPSRASGRSSRSNSNDSNHSQGFRRDIRTPNLSGGARSTGLQDSRCSSRASTPATGSRCSSPAVSVCSRNSLGPIGRPSFGVGRASLGAGRSTLPSSTILRPKQTTAPVAHQDRQHIVSQASQSAPYAQGILQQVRRLSAPSSSRTTRTKTKSKSESRSASPRSVPPNHKEIVLEQDAVVTIQDCVCKITDALGMGSFGTVWAAEDLRNGDQLAVKEILCSTKNEIANAIFESHLLDQLNRDQTSGPTAVRLAPGSDAIGTMPALVGHYATTPSHTNEPIRVRLAMTRVPGVALEDYLESRRRSACMRQEADAPAHPANRFAEACSMTRELVVQLAPVFQRIHRVAVHRDVNTHNILIDAKEKHSPRFGLVDFGLAVDKICWCSDDEDSLIAWRPTRFGQDGVYTWKYLDIAGDCRYWPVSAWTQFLIGWREIDANPCLDKEYKHHLDQHALGITALKVFSELLLLPLSTRADANSADSGDNDSWANQDLPKEIYAIVDAWRKYWKTVAPVHKRLINTFHHGGDWDALKQMCADTNFYDNIAKDLVNLREALCDAAEMCQQLATESEHGSELSITPQYPALLATSARLFRALLLLVSDGATKDMLSGTQVWEAIRCMLRQCSETGLTSDSPELPVASHCSSTASTVESQGAAKLIDEQAQKLLFVLPS